MDKHLDELTTLLATENGKVLDEAMGDVLKVTEVVEFACGIPHLMKGPAIMNATVGYDTTQYMEPLGVFVGHRAVELPRDDPHGLDGPSVHRDREHHGAEGRQLRPPELDADHGAVGRGGAAEGRAEPRDLLARRGRAAPDAPRREGRVLCRVDVRGPAHLRHGGGQRQAGPGAHRGEEPRPGAPGRGPRANGAGDRELGLRVRGGALHGPSRGRGRGGRGRHAGRAAGEDDVGAEDRAGLRQGEPARPPRQRGPQEVRDRLDPEGHRRGRDGRAGRPQGRGEGLREGLLSRPDAPGPREAGHERGREGDLRPGALHQEGEGLRGRALRS